MAISKEDLYREIGEHYRLTLRWREGLFAGFLFVLGASAVAFYYVAKDGFLKSYLWAIPLTGTFLALIFFLLDRRCHEVLVDYLKLGETLEQMADLKDGTRIGGLYSASQKRGLKPRTATHTAVLHTLYGTGAGVLGFLFIFILLGPVGDGMRMANQILSLVAIHGALVFFSLLAAGLLAAHLGYKLICLGRENPRAWWLEVLGMLVLVGSLSAIVWVSYHQFRAPLRPADFTDVWTIGRHEERATQAIKKAIEGKPLNAEERNALKPLVGLPQGNTEKGSTAK